MRTAYMYHGSFGTVHYRERILWQALAWMAISVSWISKARYMYVLKCCEEAWRRVECSNVASNSDRESDDTTNTLRVSFSTTLRHDLRIGAQSGRYVGVAVSGCYPRPRRMSIPTTKGGHFRAFGNSPINRVLSLDAEDCWLGL